MCYHTIESELQTYKWRLTTDRVWKTAKNAQTKGEEMYQFNESSVIAKVLEKQRKNFLSKMNALRKNARQGCASKSEDTYKKDTHHFDKYFIFDNRYHGWWHEEFDMVAREKKNEYFFFWMNGYFCRYWREDSMFNGMEQVQEVYTFRHSDDKNAQEIRVQVSGEKVVRIKEEDKQFYHKLDLQRKATMGALSSLENNDGAELY